MITYDHVFIPEVINLTEQKRKVLCYCEIVSDEKTGDVVQAEINNCYSKEKRKEKGN